MKSLSTFIHRTPWWALIAGGIAVMVALAVFVTPFHLIEYRKEGATPEETKAIKREIDNTFAEGAVDLSRSAILAMRGATSDPARRRELDRALEELDRARYEIRDAGREVLRAKREAIDTAREAVREASTAIEEARRNAEEALREAGVDNAKVREALEQSLKSAQLAEEEARKALGKQAAQAPDGDETKAGKHRRIVIGLGTERDRPLLDIDVAKSESGDRRVQVGVGPGKDHPLLGVEVAKSASGDKRAQVGVGPGASGGSKDSITIDLADSSAPPSPPAPPGISITGPGGSVVIAPPLPPELRAQIRKDVSHDLRKIGLGAALVLLFIPLFVLTVVAKFFIDRSRAAQRMADLKRKEAEYHRMSRQVTEAKLQALQAQVEPHFLYNTLANVQALTEVDPPQANTMVGHLIQYLRNALPKMRESISTVGQEIELVRAYLNILQMRMGKRLSFEITVPESLLATPFPPLMLPSLVENAIKHGLEPQREGGAVLITAQAQEGKLRFVVSDTGRGFGETVGTGVGLANIRERLAALYGEAAKLTLESNSPHGVIATIEVPLDGLRSVAPGTPAEPGSAGAAAPAQPAAPRTAAGKVLSAVGTAERTWRKTLSFAFVALVLVAAVVSGLAIVGLMTGLFPVHVGSEVLTGGDGMLVGAAGIAVAFAVSVLALAIVVAVVYGLGWLFAGLAIFIPVVILIAMSPALAPVILLVLLIWWIFRKKKEPAPPPASRVEPVMQPSPPQAQAPAPPAPPDAPPREDPPAG